MDTNINKKLNKLLQDTFKFNSLRKEQINVIKSIIDKKDLFVLMKTSGGKSLCFQLPALYSKGITVVISPLISLINDQVEKLRELHVSIILLLLILKYKL